MPGSDEFVDDFSHDILDGNHQLLRNLRAAYAALGIECTVLFEGGLVRVHFPDEAVVIGVGGDLPAISPSIFDIDSAPTALDIGLIAHFGEN
jgi:hypothetical protein